MAPIALTPESHSPPPVIPKTIDINRIRGSSVSDAAIKLNDGNTIPQVALGVYKAPNGQETEDAVTAALDVGYRHIDSAARYANEEACGRAIRSWLERTGIDRNEIFVTSKLWDADHGYDSTQKALDDSLSKFGLSYLDLYLIHSSSKCDHKRLESWRAMEDAQKAGKVKSIGVSNFGTSHMNHLLENSETVPAVNQVEVHPFLPRQDLVELCKKNGVAIESYSPLARGGKLEDERIVAIAKKHDRTAAQILLNWNASRGNVVLPKSMTPHRIESNTQIFDFELDSADLKTLNGLGHENYVTGSLHKSD